jgi:hypothetical protein
MLTMNKRASRRNVPMSATIEFDGRAIGCVVVNMSISAAVLDVTSDIGIPERFTLGV